MKQSDIDEMVTLLKRDDVGGDLVRVGALISLKSHAKALTTKYLRYLAKLLALPAGTFEVHYNPGGPAVSGECYLNSDHVFVMLSPGCWYGVLYRGCRRVAGASKKPRWNSASFGNNWLPFDRLSDPVAVATLLRAEVIERATASSHAPCASPAPESPTLPPPRP